MRRDHCGQVDYWYAPTSQIKQIQNKYDYDIGLGHKTLDHISELPNLSEGIQEAKAVISKDPNSALSALLNALMPLLTEVVEKKCSKEYLTNKGKGVLGNWAKSRASDKLVKMLFREFLMAYKRRLS